MVQADPVAMKMVERIREAIHPDRIILFGSRARGEGTPGSDIDLLIVAPSSEPRWRRTVPIYQLLAGMGAPKDILWWTAEEIAEWGNVRAHFINRVIADGRVLYEKPA
jgi:predicted nucleotidyltransferase